MPSFFRGDTNAHVSLFEVMKALSVGQVDRATLENMIDVMDISDTEEILDYLSDLQLLCYVADQFGDEGAFSDSFKATCENQDEEGT